MNVDVNEKMLLGEWEEKGARALGADAGFGLHVRARAALGLGAGRARRPSA